MLSAVINITLTKGYSPAEELELGVWRHQKLKFSWMTSKDLVSLIAHC
jgi:hypothetical protein